MILPFEDMSPTGDNGWFADGLGAELISALSNVKSLRVSDQQATKDYKRYQGTLPNYAKEMSIRYFIQGSVRKFGDQIKITSALLDIESGDQLWQDSMKGTMEDIFDIQEKVAEKVVEGLKVHLAHDEKKKLAERGTENAEAYELYMKANEYFNRQTKEGFRLAGQLFTEAIKLDPGYV
jgi:adenylate cyclase